MGAAVDKKTQLTEEQLQALLSTMYSRPLNNIELDVILQNTTDLKIAYRSTFGGLDLIDYAAPAHAAKIISFTGRGEVDDIKSADLQRALESSETNATLIYDMFRQGTLTIEKGSIRAELYADHHGTQRMKHLNQTGGSL